MKKKDDYTHRFILLVQELRSKFPLIPVGQHLSTAFAEYGDIWDIPDKELVYALDKYKTLLEMDIHPNLSVEEIIADAENLSMESLEDDFDEEY